MKEANVIKIIKAEGYTGEKKTFVKDPWPDIFASRQNRNTILQGVVSKIEEHTYAEKIVPCAIVMMEHVKGLIPLQESHCLNKDQLRKLMGQLIVFRVIGIQEESNLFMASRSQAIEQMAKMTWEKLHLKDTRTAVVREVNLRGATVDIGGVLAELPATELSWGWVNDVRDYITPGDNFDVKVILLDKENKQVKVSVRELLPSPWPDCVKRYTVGDEVIGTVTGIPRFGIFVNFEPGVDALVKQRRESIRPALHEKVVVVITEIDTKAKRMEGRIKKKLGFR